MMEALHQVQNVVEFVLRVFDMKRVWLIEESIVGFTLEDDFLLIIFEWRIRLGFFESTPASEDHLVCRHDDTLERRARRAHTVTFLTKLVDNVGVIHTIDFEFMENVQVLKPHFLGVFRSGTHGQQQTHNVKLLDLAPQSSADGGQNGKAMLSCR